MTPLAIEQILDRLKQLPSLSVVLVELLESFENENTDMPQLVARIGRDQGLSARVLRVANSAFYGFSSRIGSIDEAVVVLGFNGVRALAVAGGVIGQFSSGDKGEFDRLAFWRHGIGTAVCARALAERLGSSPEIAFTAGLLHDIGKLVLDMYYHEAFSDALRYCAAENCEMHEAEKKIIGVDHSEIGCALAKHWKFPLALQNAIRDHHSPDGEPLTDVIHLANILCHALDIGNSGYDLVPAIAPSAWARLDMDWDDLRECLPEIERINTAATLLLPG